MEIAIIGAGLSGLSRAKILEDNGIKPHIFEKKSLVGDRFINAEALFSILNRPIKNSLNQLAENYKIYLNPVSEVTKLILHSKNEKGFVKGHIGYTNIRGRHSDSFENQLYSQVKSKINFNIDISYEDLKSKYDYVVLATGDAAYATKLENYRCDLTLSLKGATVEGKFYPNAPHVWFNYGIIPFGYAWLIPYSEREANLVIAYPDNPNNKNLDIQIVWNHFYDLAKKDINQTLKITDNFQITRYIAGICLKPKVNNTYFVGNCFGALSPGLGFGQYTSILTGIFAAYDICGIGEYEELVKPLFENYNHSLKLRQFLEKLNDDKFDVIFKTTNLKLVSILNSRIFSFDSNFNLLKWLTPFL